MNAPISHAAGCLAIDTLAGQVEPGATPEAKDDPRAAPVPMFGEPDCSTKSVGAEGVNETKSGLAANE